MKKFECLISSKAYEIKKRHPAFLQFGKRMDTVKKELNKDFCKKK